MKAPILHLPSKKLLMWASSYNIGKLKIILEFCNVRSPQWLNFYILSLSQIIDTKVLFTCVWSCPRLGVGRWADLLELTLLSWWWRWRDLTASQCWDRRDDLSPVWSLSASDFMLYSSHSETPVSTAEKVPCFASLRLGVCSRQYLPWLPPSEASFIIEPDSGGVRTSEF